MVDGVIFVVMEGLASLENVQEALGQMKDANILGTVFNNATEVFGTAYGRYYQRYGQAAEAGAVSP
jgi:Mrp family chromosome partitioning ATPase